MFEIGAVEDARAEQHDSRISTQACESLRSRIIASYSWVGNTLQDMVDVALPISTEPSRKTVRAFLRSLLPVPMPTSSTAYKSSDFQLTAAS